MNSRLYFHSVWGVDGCLCVWWFLMASPQILAVRTQCAELCRSQWPRGLLASSGRDQGWHRGQVHLCALRSRKLWRFFVFGLVWMNGGVLTTFHWRCNRGDPDLVHCTVWQSFMYSRGRGFYRSICREDVRGWARVKSEGYFVLFAVSSILKQCILFVSILFLQVVCMFDSFGRFLHIVGNFALNRLM